MDNPIHPNESKTLAVRLRHEANQTRPDFSESLHVRILNAVGQCEMVQPLRPRVVSRWNQSVALTAAAVLVVGTLTFLWQGNPPVIPTENPREIVAKVEPENVMIASEIPTNPAVDIGLLVDATVTDRRWAYLDHDLQLATHMLLDQIPSDAAWPEETP